jgi:hypothetical protein
LTHEEDLCTRRLFRCRDNRHNPVTGWLIHRRWMSDLGHDIATLSFRKPSSSVV